MHGIWYTGEQRQVCNTDQGRPLFPQLKNKGLQSTYCQKSFICRCCGNVSATGSPVGAGSMSSKPPRVLVVSELRNLDVGLWEGQSTKLVSSCTPTSPAPLCHCSKLPILHHHCCMYSARQYSLCMAYALSGVRWQGVSIVATSVAVVAVSSLHTLHVGIVSNSCSPVIQVADRGGLPAVAAAAAAGAAGPVPEGDAAGAQAMGEDLGEFWCRTGVHTLRPHCVRFCWCFKSSAMRCC